MKVNCIVFGLTGVDTAPIARAMKSHPDFNHVIWFGIFEDADFNTYEVYKYHTDYDYSLSLPEEYLTSMQEVLGDFIISSSRRSEIQFNSKTYTLGFISNYEFLHQFSRYCYLIYKLITENDINLIIIDGIPHTSVDILLSQAARYFHIKTLFLYQANIPNRFFYFSELNNKKPDFSLYYDDKARPIKNMDSAYKISDAPKQPFYMTDYSRFFYNERKFLEDIQSVHQVEGLYKESFVEKLSNKYLRKKEPVIDPVDSVRLFAEYLTKNFYDLPKAHAATTALLKSITFRMYHETLEAISHKEIDKSLPYVYFPLNFQPELTTECLGGFYKDIVSAIEKIRALIPKDWFIYVKEHWPQYELARDPIFFKRLQAIPNLIVIDRYYSSFDLVKSAQFVATVNGTVGWEAIQFGKKAVTFGTIYYQGLPGVFQYSPHLQLEDILKCSIDRDTLEQAINTLINRMEYGVVSADLSAFVENFDAVENANLVLNFIRNFFYTSEQKINHYPKKNLNCESLLC